MRKGLDTMICNTIIKEFNRRSQEANKDTVKINKVRHPKADHIFLIRGKDRISEANRQKIVPNIIKNDYVIMLFN
jgi:hypothetical protein